MEIFLFYRSDQWNSYGSLQLVYIDTSREASIRHLMELKDEPITEEQAACLQNYNASVCSGEQYEWVIFNHKLNQIIE